MGVTTGRNGKTGAAAPGGTSRSLASLEVGAAGGGAATVGGAMLDQGDAGGVALGDGRCAVEACCPPPSGTATTSAATTAINAQAQTAICRKIDLLAGR